MSSIGTGYDLSASMLSPAGRVFQVEYAGKAVESSGTLIALKGKDGIVIAVENILTSKLHEPRSIHHLHTVDQGLGLGFAGVIPDGLMIVNEARTFSKEYRSRNGDVMPTKDLNSRLSGAIHQYTIYGDRRPVGVSIVVAGYDKFSGPQLYMIETSGESWGYFACAVGKGKQAAQSEIEKNKNLASMTMNELVNEAARIIHSVHDPLKDKLFELEMAWIGADTNGKFERVPVPTILAAEEVAKAALADDSDDE